MFWKTLQNFEISHLRAEMSNMNIWVLEEIPSYFSKYLKMALAMPHVAFKVILKILQKFEIRHLSAEMSNINISATNGLAIDSQGIWSDLDKFPRNWNEVTNINILVTLKLA